MRLTFLLLLAASQLSCLLAQSGPLVVRRRHIAKTGGDIDQAIILSDQRVIVRDSSFAEHEDAQAIELFSAEGKFLKKIGRFGSGPGRILSPEGFVR